MDGDLDSLLSCCELVPGHNSGEASLQICSLLLSCLHSFLQVSYHILICLLSLLLSHLHPNSSDIASDGKDKSQQ